VNELRQEFVDQLNNPKSDLLAGHPQKLDDLSGAATVEHEWANDLVGSK
jgi:hypothetical protein